MNNLKSIKLWHVLAFAFILGGLMVALPPLYKEAHPSDLPWIAKVALDFIERLGDAILVAVVIGGGIERIIHREEFRDYALDAFVSYFGRMLPPPLREGMRNYLEVSIIRMRWEIDYEIEDWPHQSGFLKLDTRIEYDLQNRSENPADYTFRYAVEDSLCPKIAETAITYVRLINDVYDTDAQLANLVKSKDGNKVVEVPIGKLAPYEETKKATYTFHAYSTECFEGHIVSPFSASYPTVDTQFTIWYDTSKFDVSFEVTGRDGPSPKPVSNNNKVGLRWKIVNPILPGQGFVVRCKLKGPAATMTQQENQQAARQSLTHDAPAGPPPAPSHT